MEVITKIVNDFKGDSYIPRNEKKDIGYHYIQEIWERVTLSPKRKKTIYECNNIEKIINFKCFSSC